MVRYLILSLIFNLLILIFCNEPIKVEIDLTGPGKPFPHFWESTGFCPSDPKNQVYKFLLSDAEKMNLVLIGALPNNGIKKVRIHWLFNAINKSDSGYNFTYLDNFFDFLTKHKLQPGFEFMGLPNGITDLKSIKKAIFWHDLVNQTLSHYIRKFGPEFVSRWRFETWNEPDLKQYNLINFTLPEYLRYVNGCREGLNSAFGVNGTRVKLGGPAGLFRQKNHPLCWGLLNYCNNLGPGRCPIQFISFHRKGSGTVEGVLNGTLELLDLLHNKFPNLSKISIANDESDIMVDWSRSYNWRADVRYAVMVVKVIAGIYKSLILSRKLKMEVLSFDNGFLNYHPFYFTQRTLLARFQMNHTNPPHNQFIKKPVYSVMALLSFLGNEYLNQEMNSFDPLLDVLSTRKRYINQSIDKSSDAAVIIVYGNNSQINTDRESLKHVQITLNNAPINGKFVGYLMDNALSNPFNLWQRFHSPVYPDANIRKQLRHVEEPFRLYDPTFISNKQLTIGVNLTLPSVFLVHVCPKAQRSPGKVVRLSIFNITRNEVLLTWNDRNVNTKCIRSYEVEFKLENSLEFRRINARDTIFLSYHYAPVTGDVTEETIGKYRVRAVDYWSQAGEYSQIISYP